MRHWHAVDDHSDEPAALPLTGPATSNNYPQVSLDGKLVAACSSEKVFVWETSTDAKAKPRQVAAFDLPRARLLRFAPDAKALVVVTEEWNMVPAGAFRCDLGTQTAAALDTGGVRYFEGIAFSGDGKRLGAVADSSFILWDTATGKRLAKYQTSGRMSASAFALNHAGDTLAATYNYSGPKTEFRFTDPETGKKKDGLTGPDGSVHWLTYAGDGTTLLAGDLGGVRWWDPAAGKLIRKYEGVAHGYALQEVPARFTPDGKVLVFQNGSALLRRNAETGKASGRWRCTRELAFRGHSGTEMLWASLPAFSQVRVMDDSDDSIDDLLRLAARSLTGHRRRLFQAEVARVLCAGHARRAERRFGWRRANVETGLHERDSGIRCAENFGSRGQRRTEDANPQLAIDIRDLVEPHTQADPELKSDRRYTNLSAREVRERLQTEKGYAAAGLPGERTMRDILNRMGYRLKRIQKGKPLKKTPETDATFANVKAVREQAQSDREALEILVDMKAKVSEGEYARGEKRGRGRTGRWRRDGAMIPRRRGSGRRWAS